VLDAGCDDYDKRQKEKGKRQKEKGKNKRQKEKKYGINAKPETKNSVIRIQGNNNTVNM
jgi:hypothetical protein